MILFENNSSENDGNIFGKCPENIRKISGKHPENIRNDIMMTWWWNLQNSRPRLPTGGWGDDEDLVAAIREALPDDTARDKLKKLFGARLPRCCTSLYVYIYKSNLYGIYKYFIL
mgnify:CR=1 FL=1